MQMKLLRFKWTPTFGLFVLPHPELFRETDGTARGFHITDPSDVDAFNAIASEYDWPRMRVTGWRNEVQRALVDMDTPGAMSYLARWSCASALMDALDGCATLEQAFEKISAGRKHQ